MPKKENNFILNFGMIFIIVCIFFYILNIGASLIVPFILSLLLAFAILAVSGFYERKLKINGFFSLLLSLLTYSLIFYIIGTIISSNINDIISLAPIYQAKLTELSSQILEFFNVEDRTELTNLFTEYINFGQIFSTVSSNLTNLVSWAGIIFFYTMFILLESSNFKLKWLKIFPDKTKRENIFETSEKIKKDIKGYFLIKTLASLIVGFLSYIVMLGFSLNFAMFWALLVFLLNFIPFIGSIIAVSFPSILSFVQTDFGIYNSIIMIILLISAQTFVGNFFEPKLMGNRLNLSPLVIIISLSFWGAILGFWGMVLSVPIMVTVNIILSRIEQTRSIAILLSEKGNLDFKPIKAEKKKKIFSVFKKK